ncbi:hypothetical protein B0T14DRAFT_605886 [Immersiella caudata]|uniref:Uncharacterized protein n=1 Tax=Immersiella caudata TaxID=314043 RepID=A0AA39WDF4_9PEZI|nr:hypothetical protein B0T14DRAFT_605886 [Immersiella caudata]
MALPSILDPIASAIDTLASSTPLSSRKIDLTFGPPEDPKHAILDLDLSALPSWLDVAKLGIKIVPLNDAGTSAEEAVDLLIELNAAPTGVPQMFNMHNLNKREGGKVQADFFSDISKGWIQNRGSLTLQVAEGTTKIKLVPVFVNRDQPEEGYHFDFQTS